MEGSRIIKVGTSPWRVEKARGQITVRNPSITKAMVLDANGMPVEITVRNPSITKATVLDANGMPVADLPLTKDGGVVKLALPENALYVCLQGAQ